MQLGIINQLTIKRFAPPGAYLIDLQDNEVLLPNKYILPEHEEGSVVEVFVMKDSENRIVCTTEIPHILLGDCRYLEVIHVNPYGAFVDWGLDKDLLVPFGEQLHRLEEGEKYLFTLRYDFETDRLFGSMKVRKVLDLCKDQTLVGQVVDLLICEEGKLGRNVIVNNRFEGLIFKNQQSKILERGQEMKGYVSVVRPDGKLDIRLEPITFEKYDEASQFILDELQKVKVLPLSDHSSPEEIRERLGMSKKTFKQAIGKLYRWKKIIIKEDSIELIA